MRFRKLRIAWSVMCGVLAALLIAFWIRSYFWMDTCDIASHVELRSPYGVIKHQALLSPYSFEHDWYYRCQSATDYFGGEIPPRQPIKVAMQSLMRFQLGDFHQPSYIPYWPLVLLFAAMAVAPWKRQLKFRFSLRTLLIATMLVAVVLGLAVYAARQ
jgi:hypothetical protein